MVDERPQRAYLVRLWVVAQDVGVVWRAWVEGAHTGECRAFADLAGLYAFLKAATKALSGQAGSATNAIMPDNA